MLETGNSVVANARAVRSEGWLTSESTDDENFTESIWVLLDSTLARYVVLSDPLLMIVDEGTMQPEIILRASSIRRYPDFIGGKT